MARHKGIKVARRKAQGRTSCFHLHAGGDGDHAEVAVARHRLGAGRDRVDLECLQGGDVARFGQGHDLRQLGAEPGVGRLGEIRRGWKLTGLRLIENGFALADNRGGRSLRSFLRRRNRLARRIGVAVVQHQG
jgi:hypothetical protein